MAYTQADLDRLEQALATGELVIEDGSTRIQYRSVSDIRAAIDIVRADLARQRAVAAGGGGGGLVVMRPRFVSHRGD